MSLLRLAVPLGLLALFLWRARRSPIYLLGIAFLQLMGPSVFLERLRVFTMGARFGLEVPMMVWLVVCWLVCLALSSNPAERHQGPLLGSGFHLFPEEILLLLVGAVASGHVLYQFALSGDARSALGSALPFMSMILGYFLVRDIVGRATRSDVVGFLELVVIANTVAAVLFVLHQGLHVHIYEGVEYLTTVFHGQVITRNFGFAPQLSLLALSYVLARKEWKGPWLTVLVITAVSVWVSYTRASLIIVLVAIIVALLARELRRPDLARFVRRVIGIAAVGIILLSIMLIALPAQSQFFGQRIAELSTVASGGEVANWTLRVDHFVSTERTAAQKNILFGAGFLNPNSPEAWQARRWSADMAWIAVVYQLGLAGVVLFGLVFVGFGWRAYRLFTANSGEAAYLALVYLITTVLAFLASLTGWAFMSPSWYPLALWLFAFIAAEATRTEARSEPPTSRFADGSGDRPLVSRRSGRSGPTPASLPLGPPNGSAES